MNIIADLHTHTLFSDHAYNTVTEMINQAGKIGLKAIAITDHGPAMPDSGHEWHFFNSQIAKKVDDVLVMFGAEVNVMDISGTLDIPERLLKNLDWNIASVHRDIIPKLSYEDTTELWMNIAKNPYIDMIGHCEQVEHFFDYEKVIPIFVKNNKVVEINANSMFVRPTGQENMVHLIEVCKKNKCKIAVNSDAHSIYTLARVKDTLKLVEDMEYPKELIVNAKYENLINELEIHNKKILDMIED